MQTRALRPEIEELLRLTGLHTRAEQIKRIAANLQVDFDHGCKDLVDLDRSIPGLGLHNVNEQAPDGHWTGVYRREDRPIFRGIQYVESHLESEHLEWYTRMIVTDSCYHVEGSLKRKTGVVGHLSVGMILNKVKGRVFLDKGLLTALWHLNRTVYNNAKHTIEDVDLDSHMFSIADAISVYFACRVIGSQLLKGLGITTESGRPVFP